MTPSVTPSAPGLGFLLPRGLPLPGYVPYELTSLRVLAPGSGVGVLAQAFANAS